MSGELTAAVIKDLIRKMPPKVPNAGRISQRTLDVLRQHIDLSDASVPYSAVQFSVVDYIPDGVIIFGWNMPEGAFQLDSIFIIKDFK